MVFHSLSLRERWRLSFSPITASCVHIHFRWAQFDSEHPILLIVGLFGQAAAIVTEGAPFLFAARLLFFLRARRHAVGSTLVRQ